MLDCFRVGVISFDGIMADSVYKKLLWNQTKDIDGVVGDNSNDDMIMLWKWW